MMGLSLVNFLYLNLNMKAEGIFRITAENSEEEYVREQLNTGVVPDDVDVHCLAGLIKVLLWISKCSYTLCGQKVNNM